MSKARPHELTHVTINCIDCGKTREIRNQDKHQVIRCTECQKIYRMKQRNDIRNRSRYNG